MRRSVTDGRRSCGSLKRTWTGTTPEVEGVVQLSLSIAFRGVPGMGIDSNVPALDILTRPFEFTRDQVVQGFVRGCFGAAIDLP